MIYLSSEAFLCKEENACGFRLLAVGELARGKGMGKLTTLECIQQAKEKKVKQLIIYSTMPYKLTGKRIKNPVLSDR